MNIEQRIEKSSKIRNLFRERVGVGNITKDDIMTNILSMNDNRKISDRLKTGKHCIKSRSSELLIIKDDEIIDDVVFGCQSGTSLMLVELDIPMENAQSIVTLCNGLSKLTRSYVTPCLPLLYFFAMEPQYTIIVREVLGDSLGLFLTQGLPKVREMKNILLQLILTIYAVHKRLRVSLGPIALRDIAMLSQDRSNLCREYNRFDIDNGGGTSMTFYTCRNVVPVIMDFWKSDLLELKNSKSEYITLIRDFLAMYESEIESYKEEIKQILLIKDAFENGNDIKIILKNRFPEFMFKPGSAGVVQTLTI